MPQQQQHQQQQFFISNFNQTCTGNFPHQNQVLMNHIQGLVPRGSANVKDTTEILKRGVLAEIPGNSAPNTPEGVDVVDSAVAMLPWDGGVLVPRGTSAARPETVSPRGKGSALSDLHSEECAVPSIETDMSTKAVRVNEEYETYDSFEKVDVETQTTCDLSDTVNASCQTEDTTRVRTAGEKGLSYHSGHIRYVWINQCLFLCCLRSIAAHRDHFVRCLSVYLSILVSVWYVTLSW